MNIQPTTGTIHYSTQTNDKIYYNTPNPFEKKFGYHRAIRRGNFIFVSGTTALKDVDASATTASPAVFEQSSSSADLQQDEQRSKVHYPTSAHLQAQLAMERCVDAVLALGGSRTSIIRVKMYVARHEDCSDIGEAFHTCFVDENDDGVGAVATMIVVKDGFVDPDILVEVEVDALTA